jgi:predicted cobalt transporter CbtA
MWATAYTGLGYFFSHDLDRAASYAGATGKWIATVVVTALLIYAARKLIRRRLPAREVAVVPIAIVNPNESGLYQPSRTIEGVDHEC